MEFTGLSERSRCLGRLVTGPPILLRFPTLLLCLPNRARVSSKFGFDDTIGPMSSKSERDVDGDDEMETRSEVSEIRSRSNFGASVPNGSSIGRSKRYKGSEMGKVDGKFDDASSSMSWGNAGTGVGTEMSEMRMVVRHRDLKEIVSSIKEYFDKAASAGDLVAEMLETG